MLFEKFVDLETLNKERRRAVQESVRTMTLEEVHKLFKEVLSDFEGDPWQENFLRAIEAHPQGSFYRAVVPEGVILLYCADEDIGIMVLPGSGMGPLPEEAKRHMKEAIAAPVSGRKQVRR
jgi:hypothetical protein